MEHEYRSPASPFLSSNGQRLVIRPVSAADVSRLVALYDGLDADDRRRRFFSAHHPRRQFFEQLTTIGERGGAGLVAVVMDERGNELHIEGEAGYTLLPNGDGELAITVAPAARGWLGPYLLDALAEAAATRGVPNLEADVLTTDHATLTMLRSRGSVTIEHTGWSVVRMLIGTSRSTPSWPGPHDRLRVLVESPGGRWHAEDAARAAGLQLATCSGQAASPCPALAGEPCQLAAGADAIIVAHPRADEVWQRLLESHASLHPGVPVCLEPARHDDANHRPTPTCPIVSEAGVVAFVERLARQRDVESG